MRIAITLLLVHLVSCAPRAATNAPVSPLLRVSVVIGQVLAGINESVLSVVELNQNKILTREESEPIMDGLKKATLGVLAMNNVVRKLNTLSESDKRDIVAAGQPAFDAIDELISKHVINLGSTAQQKLKIVLVAVQSSLSLLRSAIAVQ